MKTNTKKHLTSLFELLSIPSISTQEKHAGDMKKAIEWLVKKLSGLGFTAKSMKTKGHDVVFAQNLRAGKNKPTVLIYGHYDVQSPDPLAEWKSDPFKPEIRNGNIYCRGTADDKGQLYTWIAAVEEILSKNKNLPLNIKFFIEGEEEIGSKNLHSFIKENKKLLSADICVISDTHCLAPNKPLITYGLKGLIYTQIEVKTLSQDVHSGLYGGNVLNPAIILSQIITQLKDKNHKIKVPGFYNQVRKLSKKETADLSKFPFTAESIMEETGAKIVDGEKGFSIPARGGARPTLDVNGIWGGYIEEGQKTIIPSKASAKISMRLVPFQKPLDIFKKFEKYVKKITPEGVEVKVELLSTSNPVVFDYNSKYFKTAEKAYIKTFGKIPLYELSGGSIGAAASIKEITGTDCILMGYGLPDDGLHSPNEKLSLEMFEKGIATNIEFLASLR